MDVLWSLVSHFGLEKTAACWSVCTTKTPQQNQYYSLRKQTDLKTKIIMSKIALGSQ